ncbi:MAG: uncharacterized protein KVP18_002481 [Porospora cf. gigantea A]|uniref:uncharacterized protein n=1 Tax=Porospora cf. gigantea A TaxID=2853593 RepID=UPI0035597D77|nr:MAG: hypothetical protein KVP18_002481 [Porospora cf. gigantea A]
MSRRDPNDRRVKPMSFVSFQRVYNPSFESIDLPTSFTLHNGAQKVPLPTKNEFLSLFPVHEERPMLAWPPREGHKVSRADSASSPMSPFRSTLRTLKEQESLRNPPCIRVKYSSVPSMEATCDGPTTRVEDGAHTPAEDRSSSVSGVQYSAPSPAGVRGAGGSSRSPGHRRATTSLEDTFVDSWDSSAPLSEPHSTAVRRHRRTKTISPRHITVHVNVPNCCACKNSKRLQTCAAVAVSIPSEL